jgi:hypothetical protein
MSNKIAIRKANHFIDVFHGEIGFAPQHWTRFLYKNGILKFVKGAQMSEKDFNLLRKVLEV